MIRPKIEVVQSIKVHICEKAKPKRSFNSSNQEMFDSSRRYNEEDTAKKFEFDPIE